MTFNKLNKNKRIKLLSIVNFENNNLWCPSLVVTKNKTYLFASAWPTDEGHEGYKKYSRIVVAEINPITFKPISQFKTLSFLNDGKILHNPRCIYDSDENLILFYTEFYEGEHKRIGAVSLNQASLDIQKIKNDLFPYFGLKREDLSRLQGPTNSAPLQLSDGSWEILFRSTEGPNKRRQIYSASASTPFSEWSSPEILFKKGDIEDVAIWFDGDLVRGIARDIGGTVSGKKWPTIAGICKDASGHWIPDKTPHLFNRSLPDSCGRPILFHRVERPHVCKVEDRTLLSFAILPTEKAASEIRVFDWSEKRQYLEKGETLRL